MKFARRRAVWVIVGVGLFVVVEFFISMATRPATVVTVARDTTYITGPLGADGLVDYVAALNETCSQGVTPENNSAVLFWTAMGPDAIDATHRDEYFRLLGVPPLPEQGDYFVTPEKYIQRHADGTQQPSLPAEEEDADATTHQLELVVKQAWTEQEFPLLAEWLAANERPLGLLIDASKRPRRYDAMISKDGTVIAVLMPAITQSRRAVEALTARAMLRAGNAQFDLAWEDLLACHRLARLMSQGPTMVEALVADAIDEAACTADQGLLQSVPLTAAQAARLRADLAGLAAMPIMADKLDYAERFIYLGAVLGILREMSATPGADSFGMAKLTGKNPGNLDWDLMLRMGNTWYDKAVAADRLPTRVERITAMQKVTDEWDEAERKITGKGKNGFTKALSALLNSRQAASEAIGFTLLAMIFPASEAAIRGQDRATMQFELIKLACALAAYRAEHDAYPERLSDLQPDYAAQIPQDIFSAAELHYARQGDGYLLYSVGVNGQDEGGKGSADQLADPENAADWDDLSVRVPAAAK